MTSSPETTTLDEILHHLLLSSLSVTSFISRWRLIHSKLSQLRSSLSSITNNSNNPLLLLHLHLLPNIHSTLLSLSSLSSICSCDSIPSKLLVQSDLDIASSSLSSHLHDLHLIETHSSSSSSYHYMNTNNNNSAIVLPLPNPTSSPSDVSLFLKDTFVRLQIASLDLKQQAVASLLDLINSMDTVKICTKLIQECDVSSLIRLLDPANHSLIRDPAIKIVSILATAAEGSRKAVFEEGAVGPLLRVLESGSAAVRESAAAAVEAITADRGNAWGISAYGGVEVLVAACCRDGGGSPMVQALCAGALRNVAVVEDLRDGMVEEGAVGVLVELIGFGNYLAKKNAAHCIWLMASEGSEEVRRLIVEEGGLRRLRTMIEESSDLDLVEHGLRAIQAVSVYVPASRELACSHSFCVHLSELVRIGNVSVQQICACFMCELSPGEEIKKLMAGCLPSLVKMLELPKPVGAQEAAATALVYLLSVRANRVELGRDGSSMLKLVKMLDVKREEICKKFPVSVVIALCASSGCRKKLNELGACQLLQKLVESDVAGAKKAVHKLAGSRLKNLFSLNWRERTMID